MVKSIVRDPSFLAQKSELATEADKQEYIRQKKDVFLWMVSDLVPDIKKLR